MWSGIGLYMFTLLCDIIRGNGAPLIVVCNGPTPWQCSQGHLVCSACDYVIFSLGICVSVSFSAQSTGRRRTARRGHNIWFRSPETGASPLAASPEEDQPVADGRWPPRARSVARWAKDRVERLMNAGVQTNQRMGSCGMLQGVS